MRTRAGDQISPGRSLSSFVLSPSALGTPAVRASGSQCDSRVPGREGTLFSRHTPSSLYGVLLKWDTFVTCHKIVTTEAD